MYDPSVFLLTSCYPRKVPVGVQVLGHLLPQTLERPAETESVFYVYTQAAGSDGSLNHLIYKIKTSRSFSYKIHFLVLILCLNSKPWGQFQSRAVVLN